MIRRLSPSNLKVRRQAQGKLVFDYGGKIIMPGLVSNHSHVGVTDGLSASRSSYNRKFVLDQLQTYAAYGVTP